MHAYNQPFLLEEIPIPYIAADEVWLRGTAAGMCRTDVQLVDGYFCPYAEMTFPVTPGHEIAGEISKISSGLSKQTGFIAGDQVVVAGGWSDGICRHCRRSNEHTLPAWTMRRLMDWLQ